MTTDLATIRSRLLARTNRAASGCLEWCGRSLYSGYGYMRYGLRMVAAPRLSYMAFVGEIPQGLCVLHRCDNRLCIEPSHLFLGTHKDNAVDRNRKNRQARGETCGRARLSQDNVRLIYSSSQPAALIAKKFGVSESAVRHIRAGRSWRHESAAIRAAKSREEKL